MTILVHNTQTRRKEPLTTVEEGKVRFYNCGPTVYDHFHIGNARNFVVFDTVRRHLEHRGYRVKFVQNLTDIDDKIINRAREEGRDWREVAQTYADYYFEKSKLLGVRPADVHPRATEHIPQIIALIERLVDRGLAYATASGDVYYRVRRFEDYGQLSGRNIDDLREGARVQPGEEKEDPLDFALWKSSKPEEPQWDSPWGPGRPGWHIECTAMIHTHLGETIDIHSGGSDLVFPHHENECAQSCGATGQTYVRHWLHNGFLNIEGEKMSKSLGNFKTIEDVLAAYPAMVVRFFLLSAHYRNPLDFSRENLDVAKGSYQRLQRCQRETVKTLDRLGLDVTGVDPHPDWMNLYDQAMDDDFNTQGAIGVLFQIARHLNESQRDTDRIDRDDLLSAFAALQAICELLGLDLGEERSADISTEVIDLAGEIGLALGEGLDEAKTLQAFIDRRTEARKAKDFATSDMIRDRLADLGYALMDSPQGTTWERR